MKMLLVAASRAKLGKSFMWWSPEFSVVLCRLGTYQASGGEL